MIKTSFILNQFYEVLQQRIEALKEIDRLKEELARKDIIIKRLQTQAYGSKSERRKNITEGDWNLLGLPFELEDADELVQLPQESVVPPSEIVHALEEEAKERRKAAKEKTKKEPKERGWAKVPKNLEHRREEVYPEGYNPETMTIIGSDTVRILQREPATFYVQEIIYHKCLLRETVSSTHQTILQHPALPRLIPSSFVGDSVILEMLVSKYTHHIPEYRQAKMYKELGIDFATSSINRWMHDTIEQFYPLYFCQMNKVMESSVLHIDETTIPINDKPGKTRKGYIWSVVDGSRNNHGLFFYYRGGSRSQKIVDLLLHGYKGAVLTDDCKSYHQLKYFPHVAHLACWAHARRKFYEIKDNFKEECAYILRLIGALYLVEEGLKAREASADEVLAERKSRSVPLLAELRTYLLTKQKHCTPKSGLGAAISYTLNLWENLTRYTTDGTYPIDNNPVERSVRSVALGRKNWLFINSDTSGEDNAVIMTLLRTCELLGIPPLKWLKEIVPHLLTCQSEADCEKLLPYNYKNFFSE